MLDNNVFITIGIASYNYSRFLKRSFEHIKDQSFKDYEILYIDDGSSDDSVDVINGIIAENPNINIRLICNGQNRGLNYTKSKLISEARGEYLMLCDADDWMLEGCLEKLADIARNTNADRIIAQVIDEDSEGNTIQIQDLPPNPSKWLWNLHHGCLYKTAILQDNNISINTTPDDVGLITQFNYYADRTEWIYENLYVWYLHTDSEGRKKAESVDKLLNDFEGSINLIYDIRNRVSDRDRIEIDMLVLKLYYLTILNNARYYSFKNKRYVYKGLKEIAKKYNEGFLISAGDIISCRDCIRRYAYNIIYVCSVLDKLHLFPFALLGYHIISKVHYFDQ